MIIDYENDDDLFELEVEMDSDERPSGPYSYGGGSYAFGSVVSIKKWIDPPVVPGLVLNETWEDVDMNGEWYKANEKDIQAHVDYIIDNLGGDDEG